MNKKKSYNWKRETILLFPGLSRTNTKFSCIVIFADVLVMNFLNIISVVVFTSSCGVLESSLSIHSALGFHTHSRLSITNGRRQSISCATCIFFLIICDIICEKYCKNQIISVHHQFRNSHSFIYIFTPRLLQFTILRPQQENHIAYSWSRTHKY